MPVAISAPDERDLSTIDTIEIQLSPKGQVDAPAAELGLEPGAVILATDLHGDAVNDPADTTGHDYATQAPEFAHDTGAEADHYRGAVGLGAENAAHFRTRVRGHEGPNGQTGQRCWIV
mgnify:CR=1 FL=1